LLLLGVAGFETLLRAGSFRGRGRRPRHGNSLAFLTVVNAQELRDRSATYAATVSRFSRPLLTSLASRDAACQVSRAAASAAANYRAARVARSHAEFRAKLSIALEECDESLYWLEYLRDSELSDGEAPVNLLSEGKELAKILAASKRTSARRARAAKRLRPHNNK
jgi:four helix bundle protein